MSQTKKQKQKQKQSQTHHKCPKNQTNDNEMLLINNIGGCININMVHKSQTLNKIQQIGQIGEIGQIGQKVGTCQIFINQQNSKQIQTPINQFQAVDQRVRNLEQIVQKMMGRIQVLQDFIYGTKLNAENNTVQDSGIRQNNQVDGRLHEYNQHYHRYILYIITKYLKMQQTITLTPSSQQKAAYIKKNSSLSTVDSQLSHSLGLSLGLSHSNSYGMGVGVPNQADKAMENKEEKRSQAGRVNSMSTIQEFVKIQRCNSAAQLITQNQNQLYNQNSSNLLINDKQPQTYNWADPNCRYFSSITWHPNNLTIVANSWARVFGRQPIKKSTTLIFKVNDVKQYMGIGVIDRKYSGLASHKELDNRVFYASDGNCRVGDAWVTNQENQQGKGNRKIGFKGGDTVQVKVELDAGIIEWRVNQQLHLKIRLQLLRDNNSGIEWVGFLWMNNAGDSVTVLSSQ